MNGDLSKMGVRIESLRHLFGPTYAENQPVLQCINMEHHYIILEYTDM